MDVHEDARLNTLTATFELPGIQKEDINIDVHDNLLKVSGESKISSERDEGVCGARTSLRQVLAIYFSSSGHQGELSQSIDILMLWYVERGYQGVAGERCTYRLVPEDFV